MGDGSRDDRTVYVKNLDDKVTEEILFELFLQVSENTVVTDAPLSSVFALNLKKSPLSWVVHGGYCYLLKA